MGTRYYLADEVYMTPAQIEDAIGNEDVFVCHRGSKGRGGLVFSLGINPIYLFNFPPSTRIANDNNSNIETFGELVKAIKSDGSELRMPGEVAERNYEHIEAWLKSHRGYGDWDMFIDSIDVESLFVPGKNADGYLKAKLN
jgi:hypothetical protein